MGSIELDSAAAAYATAWLLYDGGTAYGQTPENYPSHEGLTDDQASYVRGAVGAGKRAAQARRDGDMPRMEFYRESFVRQKRFIVGRGVLSNATMESLYSMGYKA